jgi:hypothetical protein
MLSRILISAMTLTATLLMSVSVAAAFDDAQYPNLEGQWIRERNPAGVTGQGPFDPTKSWEHAQQAPLNIKRRSAARTISSAPTAS